MAGRSNRHGHSSDSASPDPRSKRRPERSRPPSASPPKRSRKTEHQRERPRDPEKIRDSEYPKRGRKDRTDGEFDEGHRKESRNAEREREREKDRLRERDRERHRDRHVERMGSEKERASDRDRDLGKRERRSEKETDRDKDGKSSLSRDREKERSKEAEEKEERHSFSTSADSPKKKNPTISPDRAGKEIAVATRDEASKYHGEDLSGNNFSLDGPEDSLAKMRAAEAAIEEKHKAKETKEKPSFEYSGKLAAETNRVRGVTLLFNEPPEARKPTVRWRLYIFKDGEPLNEPLYIHRLSCYLFGRERRVADVPTDHPSCSKQHAVIQYRLVEREEEDGSQKSEVRPYLMDLGSTNGTFLNSERIESQRYYELFEKDTIKFGNSSREYVLLHENSAG